MRSLLIVLATLLAVAMAVARKEIVEPSKTISLAAEGRIGLRQDPMAFATEKYMGLPKAAWVVIADVLAMILFLALIPIVLSCSKSKRPSGLGGLAAQSANSCTIF